MIKFYGSISDINKNFIIKKEKFVFFAAFIVPISIGMILATIEAIKINLIWLIFYVPLLFFLAIPLFPLGNKAVDSMIPTKILINNEIISSEGNNFRCIKKLIEIKKIIDYGQFYQIYFKWPKKSYKFLCQKDLIVEGTLEEFENLFKDKIIRKNKKPNLNKNT